MATIRQLPSGKYNVQVRSKGAPAKSRTFATLEEAEAWRTAQSAFLAPSEASQLTMDQLALRYCSTRLAGKSSRNMMLWKMQKVAKDFPQPFLKITRTDVNAYRLKRLPQVSGSTVREEIQMINKLFRWAEREMIFGDVSLPSPANNIALPPASKPRSKVVERAELDLLMSELSPTMAKVVEVAFETAMRRSEILKLTPRVLHLDERYLMVLNGKTGDRPVPLNKHAVELLTALSVNKKPDQPLFSVTAHSVTTAVRRARRAAGLSDDVRMHQLRHTRITMVARQGFNQAQIMMVSGHRDSRSMQRYTHLNVRDVVGLLD